MVTIVRIRVVPGGKWIMYPPGCSSSVQLCLSSVVLASSFRGSGSSNRRSSCVGVVCVESCLFSSLVCGIVQVPSLVPIMKNSHQSIELKRSPSIIRLLLPVLSSKEVCYNRPTTDEDDMIYDAFAGQGNCPEKEDEHVKTVANL